MLRASHVGFVVVLGGFLVPVLHSCKADRCDGLPAQAQIEVVLEGLALEDVTNSDVLLTINGTKQVSRSFAKAAPSFVFKFEALDRPPRTLTIVATVNNEDGKRIGAGQLDTTFSSNGCNFFTVVVKPVEALDGSVDGKPLNDSGPDGSVDMVADAAADSSVDTAFDSIVDIATDAAIESGADLAMDAQFPDASVCGDGVKSGSEGCDGADLGGHTCASLGFTDGQLSCTPQCILDTTGCYRVIDPGGIATSTAAEDQIRPRMAYDGASYLIVWHDYRNGGTGDIYGARIRHDGTVLDPLGIPICTATDDQFSPSVAYDGINYLVVWNDKRNGTTYSIYGSRVDRSGNVLDPAGFVISSGTHYRYRADVAFDGNNYLVVWEDWNGEDIYGARIAPDSTVLDPTGFAISIEPYGRYAPRVTFGTTDYLVVWYDARKGWNQGDDIYGARVSPSGSVLDPSGIAISVAPENQFHPVAAHDGTNFFVTWKDNRDVAHWTIYATRISNSGTVLDPSGIPISTVIPEQQSPTVAYDGNSFLVAWTDFRNISTSDVDIYASRVSESGMVLDPQGIPISLAADKQSVPIIAANSLGYMLAWSDYRNGGSADIYTTRFGTGFSGTWISMPPQGTALPVTFSMGSPTTELCRNNNETQHLVTLTHAFEISAYEVTQGEFEFLMGYNPSYFSFCGMDCPVEYASWHEAVAYCNALSSRAGLAQCYSCSGSGSAITCSEAATYSGSKIYDCPGYRLPTEAEWEYAYRAGSITAYYPSAGNNGSSTVCAGAADPNADKIGWYKYNSSVTYAGCYDLSPQGGPSCSGTNLRGQKSPNAWGLFDMAGNVWEWCHDWYQSDLGTAAVTDPWGTVAGSERVLRGGSTYDDPTRLRAALRDFYPPQSQDRNLGFRCSRGLP